MSTFNFKSSGYKIADRIINNPDEDPVVRPFGIKTPLEFSKKSSQQLYQMNENPVLQVKDNLRNLILTGKGERLGMTDYGCGLKDYLYELTAIPDYEMVIINIIKGQVEKYLSFILITNIEILDYFEGLNKESSASGAGLAGILLRISYDIQKIMVKNQKIEVVVFSGGWNGKKCKKTNKKE